MYKHIPNTYIKICPDETRTCLIIRSYFQQKSPTNSGCSAENYTCCNTYMCCRDTYCNTYMCCSMCVAADMCCSMWALQIVAVLRKMTRNLSHLMHLGSIVPRRVYPNVCVHKHTCNTYCNTYQHTATHISWCAAYMRRKRPATHCSTRTATNALQHTHCNTLTAVQTLQHNMQHLQHLHCNMLEYTATYTLKHTHCNKQNETHALQRKLSIMQHAAT